MKNTLVYLKVSQLIITMVAILVISCSPDNNCGKEEIVEVTKEVPTKTKKVNDLGETVAENLSYTITKNPRESIALQAIFHKRNEYGIVTVLIIKEIRKEETHSVLKEDYKIEISVNTYVEGESYQKLRTIEYWEYDYGVKKEDIDDFFDDYMPKAEKVFYDVLYKLSNPPD